MFQFLVAEEFSPLRPQDKRFNAQIQPAQFPGLGETIRGLPRNQSAGRAEASPIINHLKEVSWSISALARRPAVYVAHCSLKPMLGARLPHSATLLSYSAAACVRPTFAANSPEL